MPVQGILKRIIMSNYADISTIGRFFNLLKVDKQDILSIYVYAIFNGLLSLTLPLGIQAIINLISGGQMSTSWIVLVVVVIIGVALTGIMQIMQLTITENLQQKIFTRSAFEFSYRIPRLQFEAIDKTYLPELVNRFFDTLSVQKGLSKILMDFSTATLQILFGLILLSLYHPFFILFSLLLVLIMYLIFRYTAPKGLRTSLDESSYKYEVVHWLEEQARAMETFKLAGDTDLPLNRTDETVSSYLKQRKAHFKTLMWQYINLAAFKVVIAASLLIIGSLLVINQQMNIGQFVASEIIIILVLASIEKLILSMETIYDVLTAIEKIGSVTDIPLEKDSGTQAEIIDEGLSLDMIDLNYRFPDSKEEVLSNVNLRVSVGEKICISGQSSAGKSLLLQMIAGLYDSFEGSITYNDIPLNNWQKTHLRSITGDSLSKEDIFSGSLEENISLGRPGVSIEDIHKATKIVGLSEFVKSLHQGYETRLLSEGKNLPKTIRLKIMLARSIVANPKLVLLSDSFNHLPRNEKASFLEYILHNKWTVIAISNDPQVAKLFDRSVVMEKGEIIDDDVHQNHKEKSWYTNVFQIN